MEPLDYIHAVCLAGVLVYVWVREPPRMLLTPLMLLSFFVLYGFGNIIYFVGADTVSDVRAEVTTSLILMWLSLIVGIEAARISFPNLSNRAQRVIAGWQSTRMRDASSGNDFLAIMSVLVLLYLVGTFLYFRKPSELLTYAGLLDSVDKAKYRQDFGAEGGYVYQTLIASVAPFLSFALLLKGINSKRHALTWIGVGLAAAVTAGKLGTFEKTPWLVYLLQLILTFQIARSLNLSIGRILIILVLLLGGVVAAALIAIPQLETTGILEWLGYRFFEVNNEVVYQTFYVYPRYLPHTLGMNIGLVHALFAGGDLVSAHTRVASFFGAEGATFDPFFIGDAWVDFSYAGVAIVSTLVGFAVKSVDNFVLSLGKTPLCVALLGGCLYGLFQLQVTSAFTAFLSGGLVSIPMLAAVSAGIVNDLSRRPGPAQARP